MKFLLVTLVAHAPDPVRAFEDYSTLDNLSGGRLELIIGKGNGVLRDRIPSRPLAANVRKVLT